jgi:hypothetical protein
MRDLYNVTIRITSEDGYGITVELNECPRDALLEMPQISHALSLLEASIPAPAVGEKI